MKQNNMLAMILAGGRGSRLHDLTKKVAKPAVSYGGKYRIIDFPLSNCANSGIDVVDYLHYLTPFSSVFLIYFPLLILASTVFDSLSGMPTDCRFLQHHFCANTNTPKNDMMLLRRSLT